MRAGQASEVVAAVASIHGTTSERLLDSWGTQTNGILAAARRDLAGFMRHAMSDHSRQTVAAVAGACQHHRAFDSAFARFRKMSGPEQLDALDQIRRVMAADWSSRLPWPPSVNHYYRVVRGRPILAADGRAYRIAVADIVSGPPLFAGRLAVTITATPPDRRRRDLDNLLKATLDALEKADVYLNDSQIDDLRIVRDAADKHDSRLFVEIRTITPPTQQARRGPK